MEYIHFCQHYLKHITLKDGISMPKYPDVSLSVIRRLPRYYRFLEELNKKGVERISSKEFAALIGVTASQIRQDLNCFGGFGQQGYGYNIIALHKEIGNILRLNNLWPAILLGAGNLGLALANHMRMKDRGFELLGIFDNDPKKVGLTAGGLSVKSSDDLEIFCKSEKPKAAILCIPKEAAIATSKDLIDWGVKGFWNFSHYDLSLDYKDVAVENVHLGDSLMTLSFKISETE